MVGWAFAAALLVLVLGFEAVLFRGLVAEYLGDRASAGSGDAGARDGTGTRVAGDAPTSTDAGATTGAADAVGCPECGVANADVWTVTYCRACTARLD
jgi:hypothetical protein